MAITLIIQETADARYAVRFPFDPLILHVVTALPGSRLDGTTSLISIPQNQKSINILLEELFKTGRFNQPGQEPDQSFITVCQACISPRIQPTGLPDQMPTRNQQQISTRTPKQTSARAPIRISVRIPDRTPAPAVSANTLENLLDRKSVV